MGSIKMGIGFGLWQQGIPDAATLFEYIDKAEAWGIDSVWLSDHMIGERPEVAIIPMMAAIAARTQPPQIRSKRPDAAISSPYCRCQRDCHPGLSCSGGRVIMAVGLGADEKEADALHVPLKQRGAVTEEGIGSPRKLWSSSQVSHQGKYFQFDNVTITPRPAKKIDIWVGGRSDAALRRVARVADGWFASFVTPQEFTQWRGQNCRVCSAVRPRRCRDRSWQHCLLPCRSGRPQGPPGFCGLLCRQPPAVPRNRCSNAVP